MTRSLVCDLNVRESPDQPSLRTHTFHCPVKACSKVLSDHVNAVVGPPAKGERSLFRAKP
jgi:hypothetical protein